MARRVLELAVVAMAVAIVVNAAHAVPLRDAEVVVKEGDPVGTGTVTAVNAPFTDGNGKVGLVGAADAERFIWWDSGPVFFSSEGLPIVLTGGEGTMGVGNGGEFIYSPSADGLDAVWGNNGLILRKGDPGPGLPVGWNNTFNSRPQMVNDGTAYWVAGFDDTGGTSTKGRVFYRAAQGGSPEVVFRSDDIIDGEMIDRSSGVDFDYHVSGSGTHMINVVLTDTGSTTNDGRVLVGGSYVAGETWPSGDGDNWDNFDHVSISDSGKYVFSGDTDGDTATDEFIALNGTIELRQGDLVDGRTLGNGVDALSINNLDQIAFIWDSDLSETLFATLNGDLAASIELLSVGDHIDIDGDTLADYEITDFNASSVIGPGLDLAENGLVNIEVDMIPVGGGDEVEAIITVAIPEPSSLLLLAFGGLALIRRR